MSTRLVAFTIGYLAVLQFRTVSSRSNLSPHFFTPFAPTSHLIQQVKLIITPCLLEDVLHVFVDGPFGDKQGLSNLFVDPSILYQFTYFDLPFRKAQFGDRVMNISSSFLVCGSSRVSRSFLFSWIIFRRKTTEIIRTPSSVVKTIECKFNDEGILF